MPTVVVSLLMTPAIAPGGTVPSRSRLMAATALSTGRVRSVASVARVRRRKAAKNTVLIATSTIAAMATASITSIKVNAAKDLDLSAGFIAGGRPFAATD